eukprot:Sdes_comp15814_c0_seq1m4889
MHPFSFLLVSLSAESGIFPIDSYIFINSYCAYRNTALGFPCENAPVLFALPFLPILMTSFLSPFVLFFVSFIPPSFIMHLSYCLSYISSFRIHLHQIFLWHDIFIYHFSFSSIESSYRIEE